MSERQWAEGVVERTETHVQCECPPALCRHQPDGYRVVTEWGAWDGRGNFLGTFDTKRAALAALQAIKGRDSALVRAFDAEVAKAQERMLWEWRLDTHELLFGSAYGPWPPPRLGGLATIISRTAQEGAGSDPPRDSPPRRGGDCGR